MKIAGRKNDGAWFRTNKWLVKQDPNVNIRISENPDLLAATVIVRGVMANLAGLDSGGFTAYLQRTGGPATDQEQLNQWCLTGFPRQVYMGKLSWDRYIKVAPGANIPGYNTTNNTSRTIYVPQNEQSMRLAGQTIRKVLNEIRLVERQVNDIVSKESDGHVNPGGLPNAHRLNNPNGGVG